MINVEELAQRILLQSIVTKTVSVYDEKLRMSRELCEHSHMTPETCVALAIQLRDAMIDKFPAKVKARK